MQKAKGIDGYQSGLPLGLLRLFRLGMSYRVVVSPAARVPVNPQIWLSWHGFLGSHGPLFMCFEYNGSDFFRDRGQRLVSKD